MIRSKFIVAGLALALAGPAFAQAAAGTATPGATAAPATGVTAGATVYGPQGNPVGTIESVDATGAVLATGTNKVKIPLASFGTGDKGPVISLTKDQLDAQATQLAQAALQNALKVGAAVSDTNGGAVGTVESIQGNMAVISTGKVKAQVPTSSLAAGPNGLIIGLTADQINAQAAGAAGAAPAAAAGS